MLEHPFVNFILFSVYSVRRSSVIQTMYTNQNQIVCDYFINHFLIAKTPHTLIPIGKTIHFHLIIKAKNYKNQLHKN
jgi:hypothetical protein